MMRLQLLVGAALVVAAAAGAASGQAVSLYDPSACGDNKCAEEGKTICYDGKCVECNPEVPFGTSNNNNGDCMCAAGEYCVSNAASDDFATCQPYNRGILGRPCDRSMDASQVVRGANEELFCGEVIFNGSSSTIMFVEWVGVCDASGTCAACDQSTPTCSGALASCTHGYFVPDTGGAFSWSTMGDNALVWSLFWITFWLYCCFPCCVGICTLKPETVWGE